MLGHYVRRYQSHREQDRQGQQDGVVEVAGTGMKSGIRSIGDRA
jgi:hypothetical protein